MNIKQERPYPLEINVRKIVGKVTESRPPGRLWAYENRRVAKWRNVVIDNF